MEGYYLFTILICVTTFLIYINHKLIKLPVTIAVTLFSLIVSITLIISNNAFPQFNQIIKTNLDKIQFDEILMNILLGYLLFAAAFQINSLDFKKHLAVIVALAFLGTLISTFIVGGLVYYGFILLSYKISFINCLLFGALISPTDPVAAVAVLNKVSLSKKLELQITGESLINDGIAIVIFTTIMRMATSESTGTVLSNIPLLFLREAGGAVLFGFVLGGIAYLLLKWVDDYRLEILVTFSVVAGGYTLARLIDVSAPIAIVVTGLISSIGGRKDESSGGNNFVFTFWKLVEDIINVVLFLLIGVAVFVIPINKTILIIGGITIVLVLVARYLSLQPVYWILSKHFEKKSLLLFTWAALRGAVSIALALSLPYSLHRTEFLAITYVLAVFSIIVQGLTIKPLAKKLGFGT